MRKLILLCVLLFTSVFSFAQFDVGEPVQWQASIVEVEPGVFEVQVVAKIEKDWHTYGLGPYDGGPNPTLLTVSGEGVELIGEPYVKQGGRRVMDKTFGMEIDLIEESSDSLTALEFKWGNKKPAIPTVFQKAYPHAEYHVVNKDNYLEFI